MNTNFKLTNLKIFLLAAGLTFAGWSLPGAHRNEAPDMDKPASTYIHHAPTARLLRFDAKQGHGEEVRRILTAHVKGALEHPENIMSEAYSEKDHPDIIWLIERWQSNAGHDKFGVSVKVLDRMTATALSRPIKKFILQDLEPLSKEEWRRVSDKNDEQMVVMLFVDAMPGTQQQFRKVYHTAMPQFRSEQGVVTYQLSEIQGDRTHFVTYEKFRGQKAFEYHLKFPPIEPVIEYLKGSIKNPPFQQGLHTLIEIAPLTRTEN